MSRCALSRWKGKERKMHQMIISYSHLKKENNNCSAAYLQKKNCRRQGKDHLFWLFENFHKTVTLYHNTVFSHKPNIVLSLYCKLCRWGTFKLTWSSSLLLLLSLTAFDDFLFLPESLEEGLFFGTGLYSWNENRGSTFMTLLHVIYNYNKYCTHYSNYSAKKCSVLSYCFVLMVTTFHSRKGCNYIL